MRDSEKLNSGCGFTGERRLHPLPRLALPPPVTAERVIVTRNNMQHAYAAHVTRLPIGRPAIAGRVRGRRLAGDQMQHVRNKKHADINVEDACSNTIIG